MRILGLLIAAAAGAVLVMGAQRLDSAPDSVPTPIRSTDAPNVPHDQTLFEHPRPFSAEQARPLRQRVMVILDELGISAPAVSVGQYPLRGPGWHARDAFSLLSFVCTPAMPCPRVFTQIEVHLRQAGFRIHGPNGGDRTDGVWYRAISHDGRPALALRAYAPGPRLSIVIGDVGQEPGLMDQLLELPEDVTYAVLATSTHATVIAHRLTDMGREIVAHLPMESSPVWPMDTHPYLHTRMTASEVKALTNSLLQRVPGAVGADGHLGSRFVRSSPHMTAVFGTLKARGMFFLDDRPTETSVAQSVAQEVGVRAAIRTHRIEGDGQSIVDKLKTVEVALAVQGHALVVVSPDPEVLQALRPWLASLKKHNVHLLRLSEVVL
ncbi:MAG: divergent polysaccharide deacetylase family protein [Myxococcota bacterium]|nr:divergent polysaccharide deacetylase family protein [Myxococcota bacterium]